MTASRAAALLAPVFVITSVVGLASPASAGQEHGDTDPPDTDTDPPDASVAHWDAVGTQAFTAAALSPAEGHAILAYVAIAVYDSVMAVEGGYEPFLVDADAPDGASAEAAVAAAARGVLNHYLPGQAASIVDPAYAAALAAIPDGQVESDGVAIGAEVASERIGRLSTAQEWRDAADLEASAAQEATGLAASQSQLHEERRTARRQSWVSAAAAAASAIVAGRGGAARRRARALLLTVEA